MIPPEISMTVLFGLKLFVLVGIGVYAIFALVIVQQTRLMSNVLEDPLEAVLKIIALFHLALSVVLFLLALILL